MTIRESLGRLNPVLVSLTALAPSLALTTRVLPSMSLGLVVLVIMLAASAITSALRNVVPARRRLPVTLGVLGILAAVATIVLQNAAPHLFDAMGIYLPLTAVNCLVLGRVQSVAWKESPARSLSDAFAASLGFLFALLLIAVPRELLGSGTLTLMPIGEFDGVIRVPFLVEHSIAMVSMGAGGLIVVGYLVGLARPSRRSK